MPDISGFTKFINETEAKHGTHIIKELLEIIINTNTLNLELAEIEGDAIFFFRLGKMPTTGKIIQQANLIFEKFHQHLLSFEKERMCQCGACRAVNNLSIKFIIHTGLVSGFHLGSHFKLIGKDVLILHRLLKNSIPVNEYLLFTEPFFKMLESNKLNSQKLSVINESDEFDNVLIKYKYIPINHWLQEIKIPIKEGL